MRIENWFYAKGMVPCEPEVSKQGVLWGQVFGHPNYREGHSIRTSRVVGVNGDAVVTFSGSRYELGNPAPHYESAYPDCKAKLLNRG